MLFFLPDDHKCGWIIKLHSFIHSFINACDYKYIGCFRWLLDKKVPSSELDSILEEKETEGGSAYDAQTLPHHNKDTWFVDCDRRQAEALLTDKPDGTFLIRPKHEEGDVYVLSIS